MTGEKIVSPNNEISSSAKDLRTIEKPKKFFYRETDTFVIIVQENETQKGYVLIAWKQGDQPNRTEYREQEDFVKVLNTTIEQEENKIPEEGRIVDIKDDGLIISTDKNFIILPQSGEPDFTDKSI